MKEAETTELETIESEATPQNLLQLAIKSGMGVDGIAKLVELQYAHEARNARMAFFDALANFQSECPVIPKTKKSNNGMYAPIDVIQETIKEPMKRNGLSYRWKDPELRDGLFGVTCIITHTGGHSESATMYAAADKSGNKQDIHAMASTTTYLRRYTLTGSLGIGTADEDTDAKQPVKKEAGISPIMQERIDKCKSLDELADLYKNEPDLRESKSFNDAVKKRKAELTPKTK